ncbi:multidrug effflux MFS transporter [Cognatishimia sp. F0-27]|uniref:multidrug effflux MFS transporter n=1 Tax=Cognatishimia sp. F0-27 TaxID=2816855 RepID=UPI001D0BF980|nr:multidrug effflux MFS transporter [Cognatishimia sp. F0-27]MCC1492685.1 multidrug effflux MFS transporter [Cognatishimia sp. F0-27]
MPFPGRTEFIAMIAMLVATVALSIDGMLPALPEIAADLTPEDINRAQLVVTSFVLGMGVGTLFTGPLSDRYGRKPVVLAGSAIYVIGTVLAVLSWSLEALLAARVLQGLGAAGPRVVAIAIVRDRYEGRGMARILSFIMIVFTTVPALAPAMGALVLTVADWHAIFWVFLVFSLLSSLWLARRLPETLAPEDRRPLNAAALRAAIAEMLRHPVVRLSIAVQGLGFGTLFAMISSVQQIFSETFGKAESFPFWFGVIAVCAASSSLLNAALVVRFGMRRMVTGMLIAQLCFSGAMAVVLVGGIGGPALFALFLFWQFTVFFQAGMTIGNLNAIAMEPMGHIAGMAASIIGSFATVIAVFFAAPVGLMFDGTPLPLALAILLFSALSVLLMMQMKQAELALDGPA